ncbi:MAG: NADH-quinone oxidoreductase subunit M [Armatimonadota bacterium]|nr:NADH-quinone oxidoreductase subunit M [Armatimonadota bacterium]
MDWIAQHTLSLTILVPFTTSLLILLVPPERKTVMRVMAAVASGITLLLSLWLCLRFDFAKGGIQFEERLEWVPLAGVSYHLGVDGVSITLVLLTAFIIFTGVFASWTIEYRTKDFLSLLLFLVTGVFGVFVSVDLFFFFLFYEIAVLPMYLLIGIWGTGRKEYSAMKLTLYLLLGSAFILVGMLAVYFLSPTQTFDIPDLLATARFTPEQQRILFLLFYIGFGILAGIWPLHTWSPDGHASAPTAVSMLHAGVLMKLGAFGVLRVGMSLMPEGAQYWAPLMGTIAVINIVYGAFSAMGQTDLKYVIAYSSVSHMGVVMLGLAGMNAISLTGSTLQMFAHGIMTGLFFALVGLVYEKSHTRDILKMGGFAEKMPGIAVAFVVGGLSSFGLPGTSGFVAEFLTFWGVWQSYPWMTYVGVAGVVITATYVLRVVQKVFFGKRAEGYDHLPDARTTEWVALVVLGAILILTGVMPRLLTDFLNVGVHDYLKLLGKV